MGKNCNIYFFLTSIIILYLILILTNSKINSINYEISFGFDYISPLLTILNNNSEIIFDKSYKNIINSSSKIFLDVINIQAFDKIFPIKVFSGNHDVVNNGVFDTDEKSIILFLNPFSNGNLTIVVDIPRLILDSRFENKDKNFTVFVNGEPAPFKELMLNGSSTQNDNNTRKIENFSNATNRKLMIEFEADTKLIQIIGTETYEVNKNSFNKRSQMIPLEFNNTISYLHYIITGGNIEKVQFMKISPHNKSLDFTVLPYQKQGEIIIDIPRLILDSRFENKDKNFTVFVNGEPAPFKELMLNGSSTQNDNNTRKIENFSNATNRKLMIEFEADAKLIQIIGTEITTNFNVSKIQTASQIEVKTEVETINNVYTLIIILGIFLLVFFILYKKGKIKIKTGFTGIRKQKS